MVRFTAAATLFFATLTFASPLSPDPSGAKNVGNGAGAQFIGGGCLSNADCATTCCATLANQGICSAEAVQNEQGKSGCGFGGSASGGGAIAAPATGAGAGGATCAVDQNMAGSQNVGTGAGTQFITGQCFSDADCASACCAEGTCSSPNIGKTCGFVQQGCA
ncbi:hypothetical protein F4780DRAFT_620859 [Xylariomycetidae sp. FL0641]|nr:hypothetical protein F4780DRAFT_620859 [Xylariomycetidae sp. FL0641]